MNRQDTVYQIERSFRTIFRKFKRDINNLLGDNLSTNEFIVIKLLLDSGPRKVSEISSELNVSASHITSVGDSLVKKGYVIRVRSNEDRRVVQLDITPNGKEVVRELEIIKINYMKSRFEQFSYEELDLFLHLVKKLE